MYGNSAVEPTPKTISNRNKGSDIVIYIEIVFIELIIHLLYTFPAYFISHHEAISTLPGIQFCWENIEFYFFLGFNVYPPCTMLECEQEHDLCLHFLFSVLFTMMIAPMLLLFFHPDGNLAWLKLVGV